MTGEDSATRRSRSASAVIPATQRSASSGTTAASSRADASRLRAITGIITFSSKFPAAPPNATAASLPITCVHTWQTASQMTGFTLPGMIEEPGCRSGIEISASPARGPDPIQRRSLQILYRLTAVTRKPPLASPSASRAPAASKWFRASVSGSPVSAASLAMTVAANPGGAFSPVPTAVPPSGSSPSLGRIATVRSAPWLIAAAYPPNSWPRVTGTASIRWVLPTLTTAANSAALASNAAARCSSAGISSRASSRVAASPIADGNTSLDDCEALTWSFGCTGRPSRCDASAAMTSLAFMLLEVPDPVWNTSIGNWSSCSPTATAAPASWIAAAIASSSTPSSPFTMAAQPLIEASAPIRARPIRSPSPAQLRTPRAGAPPDDQARGLRQVLRRVGLELLKEPPGRGEIAQRLPVRRARHRDRHRAGRPVPGQPDHPHVVAEVLAAELRADADPPGQAEHLLLKLAVPEPVPARRAGRRQRVQVFRRRVLGRLQRELEIGPADHDGQVVRRAGGGAQGPDLLLEEGEHPGRVQYRLGLLVQEGLVGRAAALGHEQELVLIPAGGVDLHLPGQVAARVLLGEHGQRRELGVPEVQRGVRVVDAARDVFLVAPVGEHVLAAFAHHDGGAGVLAHGQHPAGRDARVLQQVAGHVPVVGAGFRVVQDGP